VLQPVAAGLLVLLALLGLIGTAIKDPRPHDIPVGLVGPAQAVAQISTNFGSAAPGAFKFTTYATESDARAALDDQSVDGILVLGSGAPHLVLAGAAGDTATGVITAAFTNAFKAQGVAPTVETVHPFAAGDAHGLILFFVVVATLISTLVAQAVAGIRPKVGLRAQLATVIFYAVVAALAGMGTAAWITGGYGSSAGFWAAAGLVGLASAAVGAVVSGLARLLGPAGIALAALVVVLTGLVSSGGPVGSQFLPDFYRALAPWMPAGQLYSALRGALFFDGLGIGFPIVGLAGWLLAGLVLMGLGEVVRRPARIDAA
jgi:hypothetical protein